MEHATAPARYDNLQLAGLRAELKIPSGSSGGAAKAVANLVDHAGDRLLGPAGMPEYAVREVAQDIGEKGFVGHKNRKHELVGGHRARNSTVKAGRTVRALARSPPQSGL